MASITFLGDNSLLRRSSASSKKQISPPWNGSMNISTSGSCKIVLELVMYRLLHYLTCKGNAGDAHSKWSHRVLRSRLRVMCCIIIRTHGFNASNFCPIQWCHHFRCLIPSFTGCQADAIGNSIIMSCHSSLTDSSIEGTCALP